MKHNLRTIKKLIIRLGNISDVEDMVIDDGGSIDMVADAMHSLRVTAPKELRQNDTGIIQYHRWNTMYKEALVVNDNKLAAAAQKEIDKLVKDVY